MFPEPAHLVHTCSRLFRSSAAEPSCELRGSSAIKTINLAGTGLTDFQSFRTSASENAADLGTVAADAITLPASSITTFDNGSYVETPGTTGAGPS
jgi:hypothetical protein